MAELNGDPRQVIEKAVWRYGVTGESCAVLANLVLEALDASGWTIVPATTGQ
jgi:hypothetical protein